MPVKNAKWNKTAILFFTSYFIVMSIPLLVSVVYYYPKMRTMLIDTAAERGLNAVKQVDMLVDAQLGGVLGIPTHISSNNQIIEYDILNSQLAAKTAQDQLSQMIKTNSFIEHLFLYIRGNQYLISARAGTFYYNDIQTNPKLYQTSFGDISNEELQMRLDTAKETIVLPSRAVMIAGTRYNEMLLFIMPVPQGRRAYGSVLVCVPTGSLLSLIPRDTYEPTGSFMFFNQAGELMYATGGLRDEVKSDISRMIEAFDEDSGAIYAEIQGETRLITWSRSGKYGWQYVNTVPLHAITQDLNQLQRSTISITGCVILLSLLLIFIAMQINYSPIQKLARMASAEQLGGGQIKNDFQAIQQLIDGLLTDNSRLGEKIHQAEPKLKEYLVSLLVRGQWVKLPDVIRQAEQIDVDLSKSPYRILIVSYENDQNAQDALARLNAHEPKGDLSVVVEQGDKVGQLIIIVSGRMDAADEEALLSVLSAYRHLAIGTEAADIKGVSDSYNHAVSVLDYMELNRIENQSLRYEELPDRMFKPRNYPIEVMQSLEMTIQYGEYERMSKIIDQVVTILSIDGNAPFFTRSVYFNAANLLITGLSRRMGDENKAVLEIGTRLMLSHYTVSEMIEIIHTTADQLSRVMRGSRSPAGVSDMLEYIESHIDSADLSLQSTADVFGMSASAFSRMFKEKAGRNFKEYVDGLRITQAKKLLLETSMAIEQIAMKVGYETVTSFYRLFKKHTGVAPGEYRQVASMEKKQDIKN